MTEKYRVLEEDGSISSLPDDSVIEDYPPNGRVIVVEGIDQGPRINTGLMGQRENGIVDLTSAQTVLDMLESMRSGDIPKPK